MIDIKSVRASELETSSTIASPTDETSGRLVSKTSQPDDKALQERMALMEQIEANPEEVDRFGRVAQPLGEAEAMADINQVRAKAGADQTIESKGQKTREDSNQPKRSLLQKMSQELSMNVRMKLMDQVEDSRQKYDGFNQMVQPQKVQDQEEEAMEDMKQAHADAQAELAFKQRLALMERIESEI